MARREAFDEGSGNYTQDFAVGMAKHAHAQMFGLGLKDPFLELKGVSKHPAEDSYTVQLQHHGQIGGEKRKSTVKNGVHNQSVSVVVGPQRHMWEVSGEQPPRYLGNVPKKQWDM